MPDRIITIPVNGEAQQATFTDTSSGSATAASIVVVMPNNMTNDQVERGAALLVDIARRERDRASGI